MSTESSDRTERERAEDFESDYAAVHEWLEPGGRTPLSRVAVSGVMDELDRLLGRVSGDVDTAPEV